MPLPFPAPLPPFQAFSFSSSSNELQLSGPCNLTTAVGTPPESSPLQQEDITHDPGQRSTSFPPTGSQAGASNVHPKKRKRSVENDGYIVEGKELDSVGGEEGDFVVSDSREGDVLVEEEEERSAGESGESECVDDEENEGEVVESNGDTSKKARNCKYASSSRTLAPSKSRRRPKRSKPSRRTEGGGGQVAYFIRPCVRGGVSFTSWSASQSMQPRAGEKAAAFIASLGAAGGEYGDWADSCNWLEDLVAEFHGRGASDSNAAFSENSLDSLILRCKRGDVVETSAAFIQTVNFIQLLAKVKR